MTTKDKKTSTLDFSAVEDNPSPEPVEDAPPVDDTDEYEYVRLPDGELRAVRKSDIRDVEERPATAKQDASALQPATAQEPQEFYVHLSDGSVERVAEEDLPGAAGASHPLGFWQRNSKVYDVIGVYPVEAKAEGGSE